jgi:tetratricopeptide (TPR) repeat protein
VLVGTADYAPACGFASLPAVVTNLTELASFLGVHTGLPAANVAMIVNPPGPHGIIDVLRPASEAATDLLLFYFAGHGVALSNDLGLTHAGSRSSEPEWTTVPFRLIRQVLRESGATVKLVILDCCNSARAFGADAMAISDDSMAMRDLTEITGTYVLTATNRKEPFASALGIDGCTAFTGTLLQILKCGSPGTEPYLTMEQTFKLLRSRLRAANYPIPQASGRDNAADIALTRNMSAAIAETDNASHQPSSIIDAPSPVASPLPRTTSTESNRLGDGSDIQRAEQLYHQAALDDADSALEFGRLLKKRHDYAEAEKWLRIAADRGRGDGAIDLGQIYEERGNFDEAERWYLRAEKMKAGSGVYYLASLSDFRRGDYVSAEAWYQAFAETTPHLGHKFLGEFYERQGNLAAARRSFAKSLSFYTKRDEDENRRRRRREKLGRPQLPSRGDNSGDIIAINRALDRIDQKLDPSTQPKLRKGSK